jgi:hypothetical protein
MGALRHGPMDLSKSPSRPDILGSVDIEGLRSWPSAATPQGHPVQGADQGWTSSSQRPAGDEATTGLILYPEGG